MPQDPNHPLSQTTKGIAVLAAAFWIVATFAVIDMRAGNPTAINGVIGCTLGAIMTTATAVALARLDRKYGP